MRQRLFFYKKEEQELSFLLFPAPFAKIAFAKTHQAKGDSMNSITDLLDLEDSDIIISDSVIDGSRKILTLETPPSAHFCPCCGYRMHSRGIKKRSKTTTVSKIGDIDVEVFR